MKRLIGLILIAALGFGAYKIWDSGAGRAVTAIVQEPQKTADYMAEQVLGGNFTSLLSDEQMEKIVEKVKNSGILHKSTGILGDFVGKEGIRNVEDKLDSRESLEDVKERFMDYLTERYCEEKGVAPEEASQEEVLAYQKEKITEMIREGIENLK